jgi:uncharacterized protein
MRVNQNQLKEEIKNAMRAKDAVRLSVMRNLSAAVTNELVAKGGKPTDEMSEEGIQALVMRAAKQRKDSIEQFKAGGREDLVQNEQAELDILMSLLPKQMTREEIEAVVKAKISEQNIDKSKANQLIGMLMKELKGKADGALVKEVVEATFA